MARLLLMAKVLLPTPAPVCLLATLAKARAEPATMVLSLVPSLTQAVRLVILLWVEV